MFRSVRRVPPPPYDDSDIDQDYNGPNASTDSDVSDDDENSSEDSEDSEERELQRTAQRMLRGNLRYMNRNELRQCNMFPTHGTVNMTTMELGFFDVRLSTNSRVALVWCLLALSLVMLATTFADWRLLSRATDRLEPIRALIEYTKGHEHIELFLLLVKLFAIIHPIVCAVRVFGLYWMVNQDTGDEAAAAGVGNSGWYCIIIWTGLLLLIVTPLVALKAMERSMTNMTEQFGADFERFQRQSTHNRRVKQNVDAFQRNQECCGSSAYESWFKVNLYDYHQIPETVDEAKEEEVVEKTTDKPKSVSEAAAGEPIWFKDAKMRNYLWQKFYCHYSKYLEEDPEFSEASGETKKEYIKRYIDAHGPDFTPYSPSRKQFTMYRIKSLPTSCCKLDQLDLCFFYNVDNADGFYNKEEYQPNASASPPPGIFNQGCSNVVAAEKARTIKSARSLYLTRVLVEILIVLGVMFVKSSFDSYYLCRHRPQSIAEWQIYWTVVLLVGYVIYAQLIDFKWWRKLVTAPWKALVDICRSKLSSWP